MDQLGPAPRWDRSKLHERARHHTIGLGIARDVGFRRPTVSIAEGHSPIADVWLYGFDQAPPLLRLVGLGATDATELPYLWGNLTAGAKDPTFRLGVRRTAESVSMRMQQRWAAFVHGTAPDADGETPWIRYEYVSPESGRQTLVIDHHDTLLSDLDAPLRAAWGDQALTFRG